MQNVDQNMLVQPVAALSSPPTEAQERTILDMLVEGVVVATLNPVNKVDQIGGEGSDIDWQATVDFANNAFCALVKEEAGLLKDMPLTSVFPPDRYSSLYQALDQVRELGGRISLDMAYKRIPVSKNLSLTLTQFGGSPGSDFPRTTGRKDVKRNQILICVRDVTALTTRANYLEDRAVKLIDHANVLESSRRDLEKEVVRLRREVKKMDRAVRYDKVTGLPNRAHFLERGAAEFQRCRRYGHTYSIVVCAVQGASQIREQNGQEACDRALTGLAQMCETAYRAGTDIAGRISADEIAILLPETGLKGALLFVDRLRGVIADTPIQIDNGYVRLGVLSGIDELQNDDEAFLQCLARAQAGRPNHQ